MLFDFLNILALATIFSGIICLVDILWRFRKKTFRWKDTTKQPLVIDYARSFFPILLLVLMIRSFLFQPYRVPTGSLEPTVMPGDFILVNQFNYGLRLPIWDKEVLKVGHPQTGQIALFRWPVNPEVTFVKRVIGMPGDHVSYINKILYINGVQMNQSFLRDALEIGDNGMTTSVKEYEENLNGIKHSIFINPDRPATDFKDLVVPPDSYFMMGDNRDNSDDSRSWGFVNAHDFIGRGVLIWMNWDSQVHHPHLNRIGIRL